MMSVLWTVNIRAKPDLGGLVGRVSVHVGIRALFGLHDRDLGHEEKAHQKQRVVSHKETYDDRDNDADHVQRGQQGKLGREQGSSLSVGQR